MTTVQARQLENVDESGLSATENMEITCGNGIEYTQEITIDERQRPAKVPHLSLKVRCGLLFRPSFGAKWAKLDQPAPYLAFRKRPSETTSVVATCWFCPLIPPTTLFLLWRFYFQGTLSHFDSVDREG